MPNKNSQVNTRKTVNIPPPEARKDATFAPKRNKTDVKSTIAVRKYKPLTQNSLYEFVHNMADNRRIPSCSKVRRQESTNWH
jgi:hypothetical protein